MHSCGVHRPRQRVQRVEIFRPNTLEPAGGTELARNATFECYWADTANDLRDVGFANALAAFSPSSDDDGSGSVRPTGRERRGETWADLLDGLEPDRPGVAQQGWGPSL